jgi:hypothetical protein
MHEGRALAEKIDCPFFETSAKTNSNVVEVFHELIRMIANGKKKDDVDVHDSQGAKGCDKKKDDVDVHDSQGTKGCCAIQ